MRTLSFSEVVRFSLMVLVFCVVVLPEGFGAHRIFPHKTPVGHILELMYLAFFILFIFYLALIKDRAFHISNIVYVIAFYAFMFMIYGLVSVAGDFNNIVDVVNDLRIIPWILAYLFGLILVNNEQHFLKLFNVFIWAIIIHVLITVYLGIFDEASVIEINRNTFIEGSKRVWFRNSGLYFLLLAWLVIMLLSSGSNLYKKLILFCVLCLTIVSIMLAQSRMLMGLSAMLLFILVFYSIKTNIIKKITIISLLAIAITFSVNVLDPIYIDVIFERLIRAMSFEDNSMLTRLHTYKSTITNGADYFIWGHGVGTEIITSHPDIISGDKAFHFVDNAFISLFYKMGFIGVILLSWLYFMYYKEASKLKLVQVSPQFSIVISSLLFSLFFVFIYAFVTGAFVLYTRSIVFVYFIILGAATSCVHAKYKI